MAKWEKGAIIFLLALYANRKLIEGNTPS